MKKMIVFLGKRFMELLTKISPVLSAKVLFFIRTKKNFSAKKLRTFNDKTTYLKLFEYHNDPLVIQGADKYGVREYLIKENCEEILNDLYGVYDSFDEIDFDKLPDKFALKCTHGCAYNIICSDKSKFDIKEAKEKVNKWMNEKYGYATSELHYTKIKPRIIIEKYLCDENGKMPLDYKFYCMNGKVECILVCSERDEKLKLSYYDKKWKRLPFESNKWGSSVDIPKPKKLNEMIKYAEKLSKNFKFVRVDLYNENGKIIFGELTFTPACSCAPYYSKEGNEILGNLLEI